MDIHWNQYVELLKQNELSITKPRKRVFESLYSYGMQTMGQLIERCKDIDRATVYRTVRLLETLGVVVRIPLGFKYKLELSDTFLPHHHHISCVRCGKTRDIEQSRLERLLSELAENEQFLLTGHRLELSGLCDSCRV